MNRFPTRPLSADPRSRLAGLAALFASLTVAASVALTPSPALAAPADLDPAFGGDGLVVTPHQGADVLNDMVIQPDGRIVVAGSTQVAGDVDFLISRYMPDGSLDKTTGFLGSGETVVEFQAGDTDIAHAVALQPDGKIVAAGQTGDKTHTRWAVTRRLPDGTADPAFSADGIVMGPAALNNHYRGTAVAVAPDGKILVAGDADGGDANDVWFITRYEPGGGLDLGFGTLGSMTIDFDPQAGPESPTAIALQPDGRILLAGKIQAGDFAVARITDAGDIDPGFGANGKVATPIGPGVDQAMGMALQPDGRIVLAGWSAGTTNRFAVVRYLPDGAADPAFGKAGQVTLPIGGGAAFGADVALAPDGKILVTGHAVSPANDADLALARFNPNGKLDLGFGNAGVIVTAMSAGNDVANAVDVAPDGGIVLAGSTGNIGATDPALARFRGVGTGYWALDLLGQVYAFGDARHYGDKGGGDPASDIEPTPTGDGYWILSAAGEVTARNAGHFGDGLTPVCVAPEECERAVSLSATPSGAGYWIFTDRGRVLPFGDAGNFGDLSKIALNGPVLDSIATPSGQGYYMVASDGGVFSFGDAAFHGSMGAAKLNAPVESLVPDPDGTGYWLVAKDGGVFAFQAGFKGSMGGMPLNAPMSGMVPYGDGYLMVARDGGIFNFSSLPFSGSLGANPPAQPVIAVAAL